MNHAQWISSPEAVFNQNAVYLFKKEVVIPAGVTAVLEISAEARYKLTVNGRFLSHGPCKSPREKKYYDTIDITHALREGENEIAVSVLQLNAEDDLSAHRVLNSIYRSGQMLLAAELTLKDESGKSTVIATDSTWEVARVEGLSLQPAAYGAFSSVSEIVTPAAFAPPHYCPAIVREGTRDDENPSFCWGEISRYYLARRPIPNFYLKEISLSEILPGVYDAGELQFGYFHLRAHGRGSICIRYAEAFGNFCDKEDRSDSKKELIGDEDIVHLDGGSVAYTPYYFRTARYIKLTCEGEVVVDAVGFTETGYPLEAPIQDFGKESDNRLWEISLRTLRRCMHETYEDCPYYEQMQYTMDTSLQMLFTYQLTNDDALARKAMDDFAASARADGLLEARTPSCKIQYIPTFSFFFIFMVAEHYKRFGDRELVRRHIRVVDGVLSWFRGRMQGDGLPAKSHFWNFVDWSATWANGVPNAENDEPFSIHALMFVYFLKSGAMLNRVVGRLSTAIEYEAMAEKLSETAMKVYYEESAEMFADDVSHRYFSQHAQVWGVLSGVLQGARARVAMEKSFLPTPQCTFAYAYFLFRALEAVGLYEKTAQTYADLHSLVALHCTTLPETPLRARSECHAWGAVVLYEFGRKILGVSYDIEAGLLTIEPTYTGRDYAAGTVATPFGAVFVTWKVGVGICVRTTADCRKHIIGPDGKIYDGCERVVTLGEAPII